MDRLVPNKQDYKSSSNSYSRPSDAPLLVLDDVRLSHIVVAELNGVDMMYLGTGLFCLIVKSRENIVKISSGRMINFMCFFSESSIKCNVL